MNLTKRLNSLQYSRRLQECCFLLRKKYNFGKLLPLSEFWEDRERHFFKWNDIPQVRGGLEYDLKRACLLCELSPNLNNYLLIFTFAHYGVWRTTRWLMKEELTVKRANDLNLVAAYKTINYLYSLILSSKEPLKIDSLVNIFIEHKVFKWIEENNWGNTYIEKPSSDDELKKFLFQITQTFPLEIANIVEAIDEENYGNHLITGKRNRETTKRNYYFWRWSKRGYTLFEMGMKWEELNNEESNEDYDRALIDDKVNKGLKSYLSTYGSLFENDFTIELFKRFLNFYSEKEAAERVFEIAAKKVREV